MGIDFFCSDHIDIAWRDRSYSAAPGCLLQYDRILLRKGLKSRLMMIFFKTYSLYTSTHLPVLFTHAGAYYAGDIFEIFLYRVKVSMFSATIWSIAQVCKI